VDSKHGRMKYSKLIILFLICLFLITSCSTRPYRMKRAERLYRQGQIYLSKGNQEKAIAKFEESLSLSRMIEFKPGMAHNLNEMAIIHTTRGEYVKAREILSEALAVYKELNMEPEISKTLNNIALTYVRDRDFKEAINRYEELIEWDNKTNNDLGVAITQYNMALIYQNHLRQYEEARKKYSEALEILKMLGNKRYIQLVEENLATLEP